MNAKRTLVTRMCPIACALQLAAGGMALLASAPSHAVHVNPSGLGQVLLYPYYTVRGNHVTALSVTNTQENHKLLKVRFLEGKNSREVMDLHLFLGPLDTWTAGVVATPDGARLISGDNSCVMPADLFTETRTTAGGAAINAFHNNNYTGALADFGTGNLLDRTREGFFEVIEMGVIDNDNVEGNALTGAAATLVNLLTPGSNGVPADCAALAAYEVAAGNNAPVQFPNTGAALLAPPRGGLMGRASLIQSLTGTNFTYDATALDGWSNRVAYGALASGRPQLADAYPATSLVLTPAGVVGSVWPDTASGQRDAVSAPLMRASISNEFILDAGTASQTDWILAHPTKRYYVATASGAGASPAIAPFAVNFSFGTNGPYGSCDPYGFALADRDPRPPPAIIPNTCGSGCPPAGPPIIPGVVVCWAGNVVPFQASPLTGATNSNPLIAVLQTIVNGTTTAPSPATTPSLRNAVNGPNGRFEMRFNADLQVLRAAQSRLYAVDGRDQALQGIHTGLPVLGFMLHTYQKAGVTTRYGGLLPHASTHNVQ